MEAANILGEGIYDVLKPYYKMGFNSIDNHFNHTVSSHTRKLRKENEKIEKKGTAFILKHVPDSSSDLGIGPLAAERPCPEHGLQRVRRADRPGCDRV